MNYLLNKNIVSVVNVNSSTEKKEVQNSTNVIVVVDCSGSMYSDLSSVRKHIKNKVSSLSNNDNTFSLIWFSGRNECGIIQEELELKTLNQLTQFQSNVDKWLKPQGLTGFVDPIKTVSSLIDRLKVSRPNNTNSMVFMTDGYDNQWSEKEILSEITKLSTKVDSTTIVEYGNYCNTKLLEKMASTVGGALVYSDSIEEYNLVFDSIYDQKPVGKKIEIVLPNKPLYDTVVAMDNGSVVTYTAIDNKVLVPETLSNIVYITGELPVNYKDLQTLKSVVETDNIVAKNVLSLVYSFAKKRKTDVVEELLSNFGNERLLNTYVNAFSKNDQATVTNYILDSINTGVTHPEGFKPDLTIDPNQYCFIDLIEDLKSDFALFNPTLDSFSYKRIGAKSEQVVQMSDEDKAELESLNESLMNSKTKTETAKIQTQINDLLNKKQLPYFEVDKDNSWNTFDKIVTNKNRANMSVSTTFKGSVLVPSNQWNITKVDSTITRVFTLIKDGKSNFQTIPVRISEKLYNKLSTVKGLISEPYNSDLISLNVGVLQVTNKSKVEFLKSLKSTDYLDLLVKELQIEAELSVVKPMVEKPSRAVETIVETYGQECADWLSEIGVKSYGFSPKTVSVKSGLEEVTTVFDDKISKFSTFPKRDAVEKAIAKGKLTPSQELVKVYMDKHTNTTDFPSVLKNLEKDLKEVRKELTNLRFNMTVSKQWFSDVELSEDGETTYNVDYKGYDITVSLGDKSIVI